MSRDVEFTNQPYFAAKLVNTNKGEVYEHIFDDDWFHAVQDPIQAVQVKKEAQVQDPEVQVPDQEFQSQGSNQSVAGQLAKAMKDYFYPCPECPEEEYNDIQLIGQLQASAEPTRLHRKIQS